jgi:hypothetical protein
MSYFLCGKIVLKEALSDDMAFRLAGKACENRLGIQLGHNIVQPVVHEIINDHCEDNRGFDISFLFTASPISDVSDELIDIEDPSVGVEGVRDALARLYSFFLFEEINSITLFFSEGYDVSYQQLEVPLDSFANQCLLIFEESEEVVSLQVEISKNL